MIVKWKRYDYKSLEICSCIFWKSKYGEFREQIHTSDSVKNTSDSVKKCLRVIPQWLRQKIAYFWKFQKEYVLRDDFVILSD